LGLGWPTALQSVDRRSFTREELRASLIRSDTGRPAEIVDLFGVRSAPYFRGLRVRLGANGRVALDPAFAVHVVLDGEGRISAAAGSIDVRKGDQFLLTHAAKSTRIEAGDAGLDLVRALPPVPPRR
jgi:mannose-6-phosphate isomerase